MGNGNDEVGTDFCSVSDLLRRKKEVLKVITIKAKLITPVIPNITYTIQLPKDNIYSRVTLRLPRSYMKQRHKNLSFLTVATSGIFITGFCICAIWPEEDEVSTSRHL